MKTKKNGKKKAPDQLDPGASPHPSKHGRHKKNSSKNNVAPKRRQTFSLDYRQGKVKNDSMARKYLVPKQHTLNLDFMQKNDLDLYETLDQLEVALILESIKKCGGNYSAAARLLRINRTTFMMKLYKVRHFDVPFPNEKDGNEEITN
jgi:DNA-binding NtrC family response regulator